MFMMLKEIFLCLKSGFIEIYNIITFKNYQNK